MAFAVPCTIRSSSFNFEESILQILKHRLQVTASTSSSWRDVADEVRLVGIRLNRFISLQWLRIPDNIAYLGFFQLEASLVPIPFG